MIKKAIIPAAGRSSRLWPQNQKHKSLTRIMGRSLISYALQGLKEAGINEAWVVQGPERDVEKELKKEKTGLKIKYVVQPKPRGTGDALLGALKFFKEDFVLAGPHKTDFAENFRPFLKKTKKGRAVVFGVKTKNPWDFGIVKFASGRAKKIVENPAKGKEPSDIKATEVYVLPGNFREYLEKVKKREQSLIDAINLLLQEKGADFFLLKKDTVSLKYPWDILPLLERMLESKRLKKEVSSRAGIGKNVVIKGKVHVAENAVIGDNTVIYGPVFVGQGCVIGANNVLRGPVSLEKNAKTGALCEIKNSLIGEGTHFHSGYVGDSVIGRDCRFGAGFLTANRRIDRKNIKVEIKGSKIDSGLTYFGTVVGNNSRFGARVSTMPGVLIGSGCRIGPNTTVSENVSDNATYYSKFKNIVKKK